jgi:hypothetical protein
MADAPPTLATPHLSVEREETEWGVTRKWRIRQLRYRTAGLCGLETSMEDFGFLLSSAMTT